MTLELLVKFCFVFAALVGLGFATNTVIEGIDRLAGIAYKRFRHE